MTIFPWHQPFWKKLQPQGSLLPSALVFEERLSSGGESFIVTLVKSWFCLKTSWQTGFPCDQCRHCDWIQQEEHPDLRIIRKINIESIRELSDFFAIKNHARFKKIAILFHAEEMPAAASHALLKTLEELLPDQQIMLHVQRSERLLATIRSRCRIIRLPTSTPAASMEWLKEQSDTPEWVVLSNSSFPVASSEIAALKAQREQFVRDLKQWHENVVCLPEISERWLTFDRNLIANWMISGIMDMIRIKLNDTESVTQFDLKPALIEWSQHLSFSQLLNGVEEALAIYRHFTENTGLNHRLNIENLLIVWQRLHN